MSPGPAPQSVEADHGLRAWQRHGKVGAAVAVVCVAWHLLMLGSHLTIAPVTAILMAALSLICLTCARHLWRDPQVRTWNICLALALAMLILHAVLIGGTQTGQAGHAGHGGAEVAGWLSDSSWLLWGTSGMAAVQVLIAISALATVPADLLLESHSPPPGRSGTLERRGRG